MGEPSRRQEVRTRESMGLCSPEPWSKGGMNPAEGHDIQQTSNGMAGSEAYLFCMSDKNRGQVFLKHPLPQLAYSSVVSHWQFRGSDEIHVSLSIPQAEALEASKWTILCHVPCQLLGLPL